MISKAWNKVPFLILLALPLSSAAELISEKCYEAKRVNQDRLKSKIDECLQERKADSCFYAVMQYELCLDDESLKEAFFYAAFVCENLKIYDGCTWIAEHLPAGSEPRREYLSRASKCKKKMSNGKVVNITKKGK